MNAALKLNHQFVPNPLFRDSGISDRKAIVSVSLLGFQNVPEPAIQVIDAELRQFAEELESSHASIDPVQAKRRKQVVFWIKAYLNGDCTLHWLTEMLERVPMAKKEA